MTNALEKKAAAGNHHEAHRRYRSLSDALKTGVWWCRSCEQTTERIEGENGQPAHCHVCRSPKIQYLPPIPTV